MGRLRRLPCDAGAVKVRIGVGLGVRATLAGPEFGDYVDTVERLGFDSLWLSERINGPAPDPIVAMAYAAGRTMLPLPVCSMGGRPKSGPTAESPSKSAAGARQVTS